MCLSRKHKLVRAVLNKPWVDAPQGLFLWATSLSLPHPVTGQAMSFEMDLPSKFEKFATGQHQRWIKLGQESK